MTTNSPWRKSAAGAAVVAAVAVVAVVSGCASETTPDAGAAVEPGRVTWAQVVAERARQTGLDDPPAVDVVRVVEDYVEHTRLYLECLHDAGWPLDDELGGWNFAANPDDGELFALDSHRCFARYEVYEPHLQPLTPSQVEFIAHYWTTDWVDCVAELGLTVPPPPSLATLVEGLVDGSLPWAPSGVVRDLGLGPAEIEDVMEACREWPPAAEIAAH